VEDWPEIWPIFEEVVKGGDTFAFGPTTTFEEGRDLWMAPGHNVYVAQHQGVVLGSSFMRPNQPGLGGHVANAGFMVRRKQQRKGIGRALALHTMDEAQQAGYRAMQFNFVVSVNLRAVTLWKSLGFQVVGTIPKGFRHGTLGFVDVYIMHRFL
jgi:GNAT superfamily N-acetyltransferase